MKDSDSPPESKTDLLESLQSLLQRSLEQSCSVLTKQQSLQLNEQLEELNYCDASYIDLLAAVFQSLIKKIETTAQNSGLDAIEKDYRTLQTAVQKSEAEIRKHIRIQQQLKLYSDSLEEKVCHLQKIIDAQRAKNGKVSEQLLTVTQQNKDQDIKIKYLQARLCENEGNFVKAKNRFVSSVSFQENKHNNNTKSGVQLVYDPKKRRRPAEKIILKSKPVSIQKTKNYGEFEVGLEKSPQKDMISKRNSMNINILKDKLLGIRNYKDLTQMRRTVNISRESPSKQRKYKYYTQNQQAAFKKQARSNSVCK